MEKEQANSQNSHVEGLGDSVKQARREMWVVLAGWGIFFVWVTVACSLLMGKTAEDGSVALLWGMPKWVSLGVGVPWLAANLFTAWFLFFFMKDTPLEEIDADTGFAESQS